MSHTAAETDSTAENPQADASEGDGGQSSGGKAAIFAALAANLGIAVTKFIAFALTGMSSMLAEGIHSVADSGNQILLLAGGRRAKRDADLEHPFGYGRERYVAGFVVSIIVFSLGGLFSLYEAYHKFHEVTQPGAEQPSTHEKWWWVPLAVLIASIFMEGKALHTTVKEAREQKGERTWMEFLRDAKSPELPVLLCEDSAAVTGLIFATVGVALSVFLENGVWDAAGAAMIGLLLIVVAGFLFRETRSLLLGESANKETRIELWRDIESTPGVNRVIHMKTMHLGPDELLVAAKFAVDPDATGRDIVTTIEKAEHTIRSARPNMQILIYLEPDIDMGGKASPIGHYTSAEHDDADDELRNDAREAAWVKTHRSGN